MYAQNSVLYDTDYTDLFALHYSTWLADTVEATVQYQKDMQPVAGKQIIQHQMLQNDIYRTVFDGGYSVLVNYSENTVTTEYGQVPANSYVVKEVG